MLTWRLAGWLLVLIVVAGMPVMPTQSQDEDTTCDELIDDALAEIANFCLSLGQNEVCYGSSTVSAVLNDDSILFEAPGDIVPVTALDTLITRPIDPDTGEWGIVLMDIQADLPDDSDGSVRLLLYGGVEIEPNAIEDYETTCTVTGGDSNSTLRTGPGTNYESVDVLDAGDTIVALGRSEDEAWYLTERGWATADEVESSCAMADLPTASANGITYTQPMQAFTVRMDSEARCESAPAGILVQTPEGETAHLMVNNVEMTIGSTAFIAVRDDEEDDELQEITISNLEGNVTVFANDVRREIGPGNESRIPLRQGRPAEPPPPPEELAGPVLRAPLNSRHMPNLVRTDDLRGVQRPRQREILPPLPADGDNTRPDDTSTDPPPPRPGDEPPPDDDNTRPGDDSNAPPNDDSNTAPPPPGDDNTQPGDTTNSPPPDNDTNAAPPPP